MNELTILNNPDFDLTGHQTELTGRLLAAIMQETDRLTLGRRKPSLDEIRAAGDDIIASSLAKERVVLGEAIGENIVRGATSEVDRYVSDRGVVPACMSAFMVARLRYREHLL